MLVRLSVIRHFKFLRAQIVNSNGYFRDRQVLVCVCVRRKVYHDDKYADHIMMCNFMFVNHRVSRVKSPVNG